MDMTNKPATPEMEMEYEQGKWNALRVIAADESIAARRPNPGRRVRVVCGKRIGAEGTVTKHFVGAYDTRKWRYGDSMSHHLRDIEGRYGYTVQVREDNGETFFVAAEKVCVL